MVMQFGSVVIKSEYNKQNIVEEVTGWLERAVIGLDLCPFAKPVWRQKKIRYVVSSSESDESMLSDISEECLYLSQQASIETTLLIAPYHFNRFEDFNDFLAMAEDLLDYCQWTGIFQIASFHPHYQFMDTSYGDRGNWTNRSPYPILHLLRESSLSRAVDGYSKVKDISIANIERLSKLDDSLFEEIFSKNKDRV